uniref:Glycosyl transferase family 28 C-terminal domain-containing protein n=1 Tax=Setaria italica TaxID=4555 RepID=K3Z1D9_SETIT
MAGGERRTVFVTVGTTCFDALVMAVDSPEVKKALLQKGYTDLLIQMGRGTYVPSKVSGDATLQVDHFTFSPSIADNMRTASLVISHAGTYGVFLWWQIRKGFRKHI